MAEFPSTDIPQHAIRVAADQADGFISFRWFTEAVLKGHSKSTGLAITVGLPNAEVVTDWMEMYIAELASLELETRMLKLTNTALFLLHQYLIRGVVRHQHISAFSPPI
jgi:hypothetical protein